MTTPGRPDDDSTPWDLAEPEPVVPEVPRAERSAAPAVGDAWREAVGRVEAAPAARATLDAFVGATGALLEVGCAFEATGCEPTWGVVALDAREAISEPYECRVELQSADLGAEPDALLGRGCAVTLSRGAATRRFAGVVRRVEHLGTAGGQRLARAFVVPALWALSQRTDARIFQDLTAVEVVQAVLRDAGLYAGLVELRLRQRYLPREHCVQYGETDLAFVTRLLAEEGVAFFFTHEAESEVLVLADHFDAFQPVATLDGGPVAVAGPEAATASTETLRHLTWGRELRPTGVVVRDFDFTRPGLDLTRRAPRDARPERARYDYPAEAVLDRYAQGIYTADNAAAQAQLRHEAEASPGQRGEGEGVATVFAAGLTFAPTGHDRADLDVRHLLTRVEHRYRAPEALLHATQHGPAGRDRYRNEFECAPAALSFRPPRETPRPTVAGVQTATVVGVPGEEVFTDEHGRVRVRFHWDRRGARGANTSAWVRVMQGPWAGNGWGFQFVPRVGMEVVVQFLEGNPDRPIVVGALYNGLNRPPYPLPEERTRSGIRTSSSPGGGGGNELRFEDQSGAEEVYLHAQRDHRVEVERDQRVEVRHDRSVGVRGDDAHVVEGARSVTVRGRQTARVHGAREDHVRGELTVRAEGGSTVTVTGRASTHVRGERETQVVGSDFSVVMGPADSFVRDDLTVRAEGNATLTVGQADARRDAVLHVEGAARVYAHDALELESEAGLVLRCGASVLRVTPTSIELDAPEVNLHGRGARLALADDRARLTADGEAAVRGETAVVHGSTGALTLDGGARLVGQTIQLDPPPSGGDDAQGSAAPPTVIELVDQDGRPMAGQRYELRAGDGARRAGVLDAQGRATLDLDVDARVTFPDLPAEGAGEGPVRPYTVRRGDYLARLAHAGGFDAEAAWAHPANRALRARRTRHEVLAPGDVLHLPGRATPREEAVAPRTTNRFRGRSLEATVRVALGSPGHPLAGEAFTVEGLAEPFRGTTDGEGVATFLVPVHVREVRLTVPGRGVTYPVRIGHLDPVTEASGLRARLAHLGYLDDDDPARAGDPRDGEARLAAAVRAFQRDQGLPAGPLDDATRDALRRVHGA